MTEAFLLCFWHLLLDAENMAYEHRSLKVMDSQYLANNRTERNIETGCFYMTRIHIHGMT